MSGNPFRRSSLKGPYAGGTRAVADSSQPSTEPLSIDTGARITSQTKRVAFRSPPALPLSPDSPVSSPPSPIAARITTGAEASRSISEQATVFGEAYPEDPFHTDSSGGEEGPLLEEARHNAEANTLAVSVADVSSDAAVHDPVHTTLGKFARRPKPSTPEAHPATANDSLEASAATAKPAMDVDAFTRLLLTGNKSSTPSKGSLHPAAQNAPAASDTSSSTDTASISRQSIFEPMHPILAETPRSSQELEKGDAESVRQGTVSTEPSERRKKPPPPKARYGKPIEKKVTPELNDTARQSISQTRLDPTGKERTESDRLDFSRPVSSLTDGVAAPEKGSSVEDQSMKAPESTKRPPTPPLSRRSSNRQSFRPELSRSISSRSAPLAPRRASSSSFSSLTGAGLAPAPPPPRRSVHHSESPGGVDGTRTEEPPSPVGERSIAVNPTPPPLPPARSSSYSTRLSQNSMVPPPAPPPRRGQGSNRTSFDTPRPSFEVHPVKDQEERHEAGTSRPSHAHDILADLAQLQEEVDAMRAQRETR